jgi:Domain of unknown function (DUF4336)
MTAQQQANRPGDWSWRFWLTLPLYPYGQRRTLRSEVVANRIWTFDQIQGVLYVAVPIRMTVVRLDEGGLLVYAPVAPTPECVRLVQELVSHHGDVKYIILPTVSGLEHKVFVGPFARKFPKAQVYVAPHQWSFPVNLPLSWLGFPVGRTHILPEDSGKAPFGDQFDYAMLNPIDLGLGTFGEVAFLERRSQTLLVTDTVLVVPEEPPAIVQLTPDALLFHAKDDAFDRVKDDRETRRKGWQRISLFAFYFRPSALETIDLGQAWRDAKQAPDRSKKFYFGFFPFQWREDWGRSFEVLRGEGRLLVAPILQRLILNRAPKETLAWADRVSQWHFQRIIPCHFESPIHATPQEFRQAFAFLEKQTDGQHLFPEADFGLLNELDLELCRRQITPPAQEKV